MKNPFGFFSLGERDKSDDPDSANIDRELYRLRKEAEQSC